MNEKKIYFKNKKILIYGFGKSGGDFMGKVAVGSSRQASSSEGARGGGTNQTTKKQQSKKRKTRKPAKQQ